MNQRSLSVLVFPLALAGCVEPPSFDSPDTSADTATDGGGMGTEDVPEDRDPDPDDKTGGDDTGGGETGGGETTGGDTLPDDSGPEEPACDPQTHRCVAPPPEGWEGPVAKVAAGNDDGCGGAYPLPAVNAWGDVVGDSPECSCECGDPANGDCGTETDVGVYYVNFFGANLSGCEVVIEEVSLDASEGIFGLGSWPNAVRFIADEPAVVDAGECEPFNDTEYVPEVERLDHTQACSPIALPPKCEDSTLCVPQPADGFEAGVCIWAEGDLDCPDGDYSEKTLTYDGIDDDRRCDACTCDAPGGVACDDATLWVYHQGSLIGTPIAADGVCHTVAGNQSAPIVGISFQPGDPDHGHCEPHPRPRGDVVVKDPITVCCMAD